MQVDLPMRVLRPFLGARIIKTGLAVFISLAAFQWLGSAYGTFAAVAAILAVQPAVSRARSAFLQQLAGNLIGGAMAAALGRWLGPTASAMAIGVVLTLGLCTQLRLTEAAAGAVVSVIFILDRPQHDFLVYTAARVGAIAGGMLIGYLVNRFIRPPNYTRRVSEALQEASEGIDKFGSHLLASLGSPEHYHKDQIKGEATAILKELEAARYLLDLYHDSDAHQASHLPLEKTKSSLFVFVERIMDIHKSLLQTGGLQPGAELGTVATALKTVLRYKEDVVAAALGMGAPDPAVAVDCQAALAELERLVAERVADPHSRARGLALHSLLTNIRHMTARMESLTRVLLGMVEPELPGAS
ncbi:MAG: hypothetical protein JWN15_4376 [Firmicutes bacterium]|nr:hypothetical protein [Bacillota bacterium]